MSVDFIDSNVFVYLFDPNAPAKRQAAEDLIRRAVEGGTASISFQVVQETLNVITRKAAATAASEAARAFLDEVLVPLWRVMPTQGLYERALEIQARYRTPSTTLSSLPPRSPRGAPVFTARTCSTVSGSRG